MEERATTTRLRRSPLHAAHVRLGGQMVDFEHWEMPVKYSGIVEEHHTVRKAAGLFDISHMGEIWINGLRAADFLNWVLTNDVSALETGQAQYSLMCNEVGGVLDDLYVYRIGAETFLLMVNASRTGRDMLWLEEKLEEFGQSNRVVLKNVSQDYGAVALQGRASEKILSDAIGGNGLIKVDRPSDLQKNEIEAFALGDRDVYVARTGYTGEDGFEVIAPAECIGDVWNRLLTAGESEGLKPCGLGARDTLRLEMGYPLYGHELSEQITPLEAGLGYFVKLGKGEFVGSVELANQKEKKPNRKCVAFRLTDKAPPPRAEYTIWGRDTVWKTGDLNMIGKVTSGNQSPSLGIGIGLALVQSSFAGMGTKLEVNIRNRNVPAEVVKKPFYKPKD
ncbi:MAG: glycine cleavage system protein T [Verrucomicrobiales bacterium]|nr:glycine cleavage system protein T [Verrucomicrobiales bacterium]